MDQSDRPPIRPPTAVIAGVLYGPIRSLTAVIAGELHGPIRSPTAVIAGFSDSVPIPLHSPVWL
jgi:hypothetical protein